MDEKRKEEFRKWFLDRFRKEIEEKEIRKFKDWDEFNRWVEENGDKWDKFLRDLTIPDF